TARRTAWTTRSGSRPGLSSRAEPSAGERSPAERPPACLLLLLAAPPGEGGAAARAAAVRVRARLSRVARRAARLGVLVGRRGHDRDLPHLERPQFPPRLGREGITD